MFLPHISRQEMCCVKVVEINNIQYTCFSSTTCHSQCINLKSRFHSDWIAVFASSLEDYFLFSILILLFLLLILLLRLPIQLKPTPNTRTLDLVGRSQPIGDCIHRRLYGSVDDHGGCRFERWCRRGCCCFGGTSLNGRSRGGNKGFSTDSEKRCNDCDGGYSYHDMCWVERILILF